MITTVTTEAARLPGFDEQAFRAIVEACNDRDAAARTKAFEAFQAAPFPTARHEEWRRTDPALFSFEGMSRLDRLAMAGDASSNDLDEGFDVVISVTDHGYRIEDRTGVTEAGIADVYALADVPAETMEGYLDGPAVIEPDRSFTLLNGAFWNIGFFIRIHKDQTLGKGILIRYEHGTENSVILPRLVVVAEPGSKARVVEWYQSPEDVKLMCVGARELYVQEAASLKLQSVQEWGKAAFHIGEDWARVERDGVIDWLTLTLGSGLSKLMMGCDVAGANASAYMSGLFFANGDQHVDQRTLQKHSSPHTYSNLLYKGAVKDQGHSVYQGFISASPGAIDVDAYQMNNNLILNTGARADSLPGLMIDADDLKCSHGATMGNIDPEQLFYLQSRGFSESEARRMLVLAFFEDIIAKLDDDFLEDRIRADVNRKIG